tara:strand:+ start:3311 stop:3829 length:519 start_codon:yes stop_codon:yes gene_type:complete
MNKIVDPLEQLLIDIKTGVEHLESRPAPNQATDYRGQMRDMTAEISNLSLMVKGLGEGISKIPSPLTYRDLENAIAENAEAFRKSASSIRDSLHGDHRRKLGRTATICALLVLLGGGLGLFFAEPMRPYLNWMGLTFLGQDYKASCEDLGGSVRSDKLGNLYCVYWIEKGSN